MALTKLNSKTSHERIVNLVKNSLENENRLISSRRAIVKELVDNYGITTEDRFKEIRNYIVVVYKSLFSDSTLWKRIIPSGFIYEGREFTNDLMFYDEGSRLKLLAQKSGKKGKLKTTYG